MKAFGSNVVCKPAKAPETSPGGLVIPESAGREYKLRGFVTNIGDEVDVFKSGLEVGNEIIFAAGSKFTVNNEDYIVVAAKNILVIV
jgi:co-chaperonin GroES (HSP10)